MSRPGQGSTGITSGGTSAGLRQAGAESTGEGTPVLEDDVAPLRASGHQDEVASSNTANADSTSPVADAQTQAESRDGLREASVKQKWKAFQRKLPKVSKLAWSDALAAIKGSFSNPVHVVAFVWCLLALPWCVIIGLYAIGALKYVITDQEASKKWDEIAHQIMNALFVLMAVVLLPLVVRHTYLLIRWIPRDRLELRHAYCRQGGRKPHDRMHIGIVLAWGHVTIWATLAYALIYWFVAEADRPSWVLWVMGTLSMLAPVMAILHLVFSPLGQEFNIEKEGDNRTVILYERRYAFFLGDEQVKDAQWEGTVCPGCCADRTVAWLTCFCTLCMFGYNMERLGFGNWVVQALAFLVVILGPFIVFAVTAGALAHSGYTSWVGPLVLCGILLTFLGFAYGGMWRTQMRKVFGLPGSELCCGSTRLTDACTWLWCCCCALCQEIRTVDSYNIGELVTDRQAGEVHLALRVETGDSEADECGKPEEASADAPSAGPLRKAAPPSMHR